MSDTSSARPVPESLREARATAQAEDAFWREHYQLYLEQYPDRFVAAARDDGRLVAADEDLSRLIDKVKENGLDVRRVWVRYMAATPIRFAL